MRWNEYRGPNSSGPCKDCTERHIGCHGECERYQEYDRQNELRRKHRGYVAEKLRRRPSWSERGRET